MITRLPRWVWLGGFVLAFVAGMINVVGLLSFEHQAVSHLTATTSRFSVAIATADVGLMLAVGGLIFAFFGGAVLSGWLIRSRALELGRHYATALFFESFLLCSAVVLLYRHNAMGMYLSCAACGLQNAMASAYSGAVVRTTHMTGLFTDLGIEIGEILRGLPPDWRRIHLCGVLIGGFTLGGVASALAFPSLDYATLLIPAAITGITAALYRVYARRHLDEVADDGSQAAAALREVAPGAQREG